MELVNEGVANLMIAVTERAYADYVQYGIFLKKCEYETIDGVIHVHSINGREIKTMRERRKVDKLANLYSTAKKFFDGTSWGDYLIRKGNEEIAIGYHKKTRRYEHRERSKDDCVNGE